jgi:multisubunit Na+/H+ antiporter MnhC subunit
MTTPFIDTVVDALVYVALVIGVASLLFFIFYAAREHIRYHWDARHVTSRAVPPSPSASGRQRRQ